MKRALWMTVLFLCLSALVSYASTGDKDKQGHATANKKAAKHEATVPKGHDVHWGYEGEGAPEHWGYLNPTFAQCRKGDVQSPVDIGGSVKASLAKLVFQYNASAVTVVNNGHTVQANFQPGSKLVANGGTYELLQLHFHTPSEHTVKSHSYPMEMHLVHKNTRGQLAVVGVLFESKKVNPALQMLWKAFPPTQNEPVKLDREFNAAVLLPKSRTYYHYIGSLTTPPCTEGVNWYVLRTSQIASGEQVSRFSSVFNHNARPVQPLNARFILEYK